MRYYPYRSLKKGTEKWKNGKKDLKRILRIERTIPEVRYDDWEIRKGQLEFESKCPIDLLKGQRSTMWNYLRILEQRAKIEEIKL